MAIDARTLGGGIALGVSVPIYRDPLRCEPTKDLDLVVHRAYEFWGRQHRDTRAEVLDCLHFSKEWTFGNKPILARVIQLGGRWYHDSMMGDYGRQLNDWLKARGFDQFYFKTSCPEWLWVPIMHDFCLGMSKDGGPKPEPMKITPVSGPAEWAVFHGGSRLSEVFDTEAKARARGQQLADAMKEGDMYPQLVTTYKVTGYRVADGKTFGSLAEAEAHVAKCHVIAWTAWEFAGSAYALDVAKRLTEAFDVGPKKLGPQNMAKDASYDAARYSK